MGRATLAQPCGMPCVGEVREVRSEMVRMASQCVGVFCAAADVMHKGAGNLFRRSCFLFGPGLTWLGAGRYARPGRVARALCSRNPVRQAACRS